MAYFTEPFSNTSLNGMSTAINAYLAANPTFVLINASVLLIGINFNAILTYSTP